MGKNCFGRLLKNMCFVAPYFFAKWSTHDCKNGEGLHRICHTFLYNFRLWRRFLKNHGNMLYKISSTFSRNLRYFCFCFCFCFCSCFCFCACTCTCPCTSIFGSGTTRELCYGVPRWSNLCLFVNLQLKNKSQHFCKQLKSFPKRGVSET